MSKGKLALGALVSAAAGFVTGILTAPKSGKETRADLKQKAEEVKSEVKKTAEKKTAEKRTRKTAVKESVYLQYLGKELNSADIVEAAKKASGEKTITSITVYLKPEENKAYYVVNGDVTGSVEL